MSAAARSPSVTDLGELAPESSRQDREAAPRLWVQVLVVEVKRRRIALALPLVAAEQGEEPRNPLAEQRGRILREPPGDLRQDVARDELVPDGQALDDVEDGERHEIALRRLLAVGRAKLRRGVLPGHRRE